MFQHKTRGNASPQGKQKVYFTCHPDDFGLYYEKISNQILEFANCAIWHWDSEEDYQDIHVDLGGMRLFVIPVTSKLLTTANRTMKIDLPFAKKNNIPVLPLMQEGGLDELFGRKFGDRHYLDENKSREDPTTAPYEEKLKRYLASVIVGDELSEKVRKAFDAYIFLSYRKKDRKYAQELMRLIHENDFCRDIAIWYDEFLTPGENFNDAIAAALRKSELFALVVTPNLVNEENYVKSTEYPMARDAEKKILPAELVDTDRAKLAEMYEDIPDCVNPSDRSLLSEALLDALRSIAKRENDSDIEHNFFIGLAYLNGIDVEVNPQRARELICSSAEAGLLEAIEKLVSMYQNGDGVDRDYQQAIEYQRKLVGLLRESRGSRGSYELIVALCNLGDYLYDIRNLSEAEAVYKEIWEYPSAGSHLMRSYSRLGDIRMAQGQLVEAEGFYQTAMELSEDFSWEIGGWEARRKQMLAYANFGDIRMAQGKLAEAEGFYQKALELSEDPAGWFRGQAWFKMAEAFDNLSMRYASLGDIRKAQKQFAVAEGFYQISLELKKTVVRESQTVKARRGLSMGYLRLGENHKAQGNLAEAEGFCQKSLELTEALVRETQTVQARRDLALCYGHLGEIREAQGNLAEAEGFCQKSLELTEELARETQTVQARRDLALCYSQIGKIREAQGRLTKAEGFYRKSLELREALAEESQTVEARRNLAVSYRDLMDICVKLGQYDEADGFHRKSLELREELVGEPHTAGSRCELMVSYEHVGSICKAQGYLAEAAGFYRKCIELGEILDREAQTEEARNALTISYARLVNIYADQAHPAVEEGVFQKYIRAMEDLTRETLTEEARRDLARVYGRLGFIRVDQGQLAEADGFFQKYIEVMEGLVREAQAVEERRTLAHAYDALGALREAQGQFADAEFYYKKASELLGAMERETS